MTSITTDDARITVHAVMDHAPEVAWVHTHGMAQLKCPDLEWYWSPKETWGEAARILGRIASRVAESGEAVKAGDRMTLRGEQAEIRLTGPTVYADHEFAGNQVLRVEKVTTGAEGVRLFRQLIGVPPDSSEHARRALELQAQGRLEEAEVEYEEALAADPCDVFALNNLGQLLVARGDAHRASRVLARATRAEPSFPLAHNNYGNALLSLGRSEEAEAAYRSAAACDPSYAMPHRNLALAHQLSGRLAEAVEEYRTYFHLAPAGTKDADAHFNLGVMLEEGGNVDGAVEEYGRALADDPRHAKALNNLGLVHFSRGETETAAEFYRKAQEADERFALARYNLGLALAARGEHGAAAEEFERVLALAPDNVQAASNLGVLYTTLGRCDEAVEILERLVAAEPSQPTFRFNLALAYQGKGMGGKADAELREVIELEPPGSPRAERARRVMASAF